jgi:LacI family transcriptional regulator
VDNDELLCELSGPPLSSVAHDLHGIGYRAAQLLDSLMAGGSPPTEPELIAPLRVVARRSSDIVAVDDPDVAQALHLIHEHATDGINVEEIIQKMTISHASLSRRFQKTLGRSPKAEILRVQLERVQQLLTDSDLKLSAIANMAGFAHPEHMMAIFKQKTGLSPTEYRKSARSSRPGAQS